MDFGSCLLDAPATAFADPEAACGLCCLDLDHFKTVNDTFGHYATGPG